MPEPTKITGYVDRIINREYGFIKSPITGQTYFLHKVDFHSSWDELIVQVRRRQVVIEFDPLNTRKGPRARNARILNA